MTAPCNDNEVNLSKEIKRCQKLLLHYEAIGIAGKFLAMILRHNIRRANIAIDSHDGVMIILECRVLKNFKTARKHNNPTEEEAGNDRGNRQTG